MISTAYSFETAERLITGYAGKSNLPDEHYLARSIENKRRVYPRWTTAAGRSCELQEDKMRVLTISSWFPDWIAKS